MQAKDMRKWSFAYAEDSRYCDVDIAASTAYRMKAMSLDHIVVRFLDRLLKGDRVGCRGILGEALQTGTPARVIYTDLFWPVMAEIDRLYREHRIDRITEHMATRINRTLVDQLQSKLPRREPRNMKMIITCSASEQEELGAQMCADMFESDGWEVLFIGGEVPNDEIMALVHQRRPNLLFIYGTRPSEAPGIRQLIDQLRTINACPDLRVMLSGGVFNRAEGLWDEIGADLFAPTAKEALDTALSSRRAPTPKRRPKRRASRVDAEAEMAPTGSS